MDTEVSCPSCHSFERLTLKNLGFFILNSLDLNTTNVAKDIFIFKTYTKNKTWSWKVMTLQKPARTLKKIQNIAPDNILGKIAKFNEIRMSY